MRAMRPWLVVLGIAGTPACQALLDLAPPSPTADAGPLVDAAKTPADATPDTNASGNVDTIATRNAVLDSLVVEDAYAYWVEKGPVGRIARVALETGAVEVLVDNVKEPSHVARFAGTIVWSAGDTDGGAVRALVDKAQVVLTTALKPTWLAVSGSVYFAFVPSDGPQYGAIGSCNLQGCIEGQILYLFESSPVEQLRATGAELAWVVNSVDLRACTPNSALSPEKRCFDTKDVHRVVSEPSGIVAFDADADRFYVARGGGEGGIYAVARDGGAKSELVPAITDVSAIAADGDMLSFADRARGTISSVPKAGGGVVEIARVDGGAPHSLVGRGAFLYWLDSGKVLRALRANPR